MIQVEDEALDRVFYILFQGCFTINIAHQIKRSARLLTEVANRFKLNLERECLANLQYHCLTVQSKEIFEPIIPTLLMEFYENNLLTESYLKAWQTSSKDLKFHFLFNEAKDDEFKTYSKQMLEWLK